MRGSAEGRTASARGEAERQLETGPILPHNRGLMPIFGSSGRTSNPLANMGLALALLGAAFSAVLWLYHFQPDSTLLGSYSEQIAGHGQLHDNLNVLAAFFGLFGVLAGIFSSFGGLSRGAAPGISVVLGVAALSYPVLNYLNIVSKFVPNPVK